MQQQLQFVGSILLFWIINIINHIMTRARRSIHERRTWYTPGLNHPHSSDINTLIVFILGKPLSFARTGQGRFGHRYDPIQIERALFRDAILNLFLLSHLPLYTFGTEAVEIEVIFTFNQKYIANDLDNLVKFVMDALQDAHIYDNDVQVMNIKPRKTTGPVDMTQIVLHCHILVVGDDNDDDE